MAHILAGSSLLATLLFASTLTAQNAAPASDTEALAKATQNPVASLISVPFQNNTNFAIGPYNRTQNILNIQPVIPAKISPHWMLISRIIQPIVWQPYSSQFTGGEFGFGDMSPTFFLSPAKPGKLIWGAGPAWVFPTATNQLLGQGKVSVGPSKWSNPQKPSTVPEIVRSVDEPTLPCGFTASFSLAIASSSGFRSLSGATTSPP